MPDFNERPTLTFLSAHQTHLEDTWRETRANWRDTDLFRQLQYEVWLGPGGQSDSSTRGEYRPPTARTIIDASADQFTALIPKIRRQPLSNSEDARLVADVVEVALKSIMTDAIEHSMENPWRLLGKHFNAYGYGIMELELDFESEQSAPAFWNPVRLDAISPGRVLIDPLEKEPNAAIKIFTMPAVDVVAMMKSKRRLRHVGKFDMSGRQPWETITLTKHWTGKNGWMTVRESGGDILFQQKNLWGFVPFTHAFAGYGMEPVSDPSRPLGMRLQFKAEGLLDGLKPTLRMQAQSQTGKHRMEMDQAFAPYISNFPEEMRKALEEGTIAHGQALDYAKMQIQDVPRWMFQRGVELQQFIDQSVGGAAQGGIRQPGVDTVGQEAILNNEMRRKFIGSSMQQEHMASILVGWIMRLTDKLVTLRKGIGAHGDHLTRSAIAGHYDARATFEVSDPVFEQQRKSSLRDEYLLGLLDEITYWEQTGVENITVRRERLRQQRVRNSPSVVAKEAGLTAEGMADLDEDDREAVMQDALAGNLTLVRPSGQDTASASGRQPIDGATAKPERIQPPR